MASSIGQSTFLAFCPTCSKAFTRETSYNRHISYCRRAQAKNKGRSRSCVACNSSKVKCTFTEPQCARCESKGISCIYRQSHQRVPVSLYDRAGQRDAHQAQPLAPETPLPFDFESEGLETTMLPLDDILEDATLFHEQDDFSQDITATDCCMNLTPSATPSNHLSAPVDLLPPPFRINNLKVTENRTTLTRVKHQDLAVDYISDLIICIIKAFPRMMLRRQTFPPFIHPYWHWGTLPEKLASCMSIAQLFEARTAETQPFLWRVIDAEEQRFREETMTMSVYEIQWASQALMIYIIMAIVDQEGDHTVRGRALLHTLEVLSARAHVLRDSRSCSATEETCPSKTWDEWIFAESNRRIGCLWFVICLVFTTNDSPCPGFEPYERIALASPKLLWEARTQKEWQNEKALHEISRPFQEFGELIEARRGPNGIAQRLEAWEAGTDKLGLLMNFAVAFV